MNFKKFVYALPFFLIFTILPVKVYFAGNENPGIFVKNIVDEFLVILRSDESKGIQREKIVNIMKNYFDFHSITEDLLSGLKVDDNDKSALADIFPLLLERNYYIYVKSPGNLSVDYKGYEILDNGLKAVVHTHTKIFSYHDIDLDYKLHLVNGEWKIYDITAGGISLVDNYKAQIHKVLKRMSFSEFLIYLEKIVNKKTDS